MKYYSTILVFLIFFAFPEMAMTSEDGLLKPENDWEILFDGNGTDQWRSKTGPDFPEAGWKTEGELLYLEKEDGGGGDIVTREKYGNFELVFEFNLTREANSGIKYFVDTVVNRENGRVMINGPEYQIIDDYHNTHVKDDPHGMSSTASVYLFYAPENKKLNPPGEWNTGRIISRNGQVEHWLNGVKVVSYTRGSMDFFKRKAETKFRNDKDYGTREKGHIMLTDHNDKVFFRNIKIKKLQ